MNTKILYFDDNSNAYAYPAAKLVNMRESAATTVDIYFGGTVGVHQDVTKLMDQELMTLSLSLTTLIKYILQQILLT